MIRVLLVEDDPMVLEILGVYVRRVEGFTVAATAINGREAMAALEAGGIDLVIADIFMSEMKGDALLEEIRRNRIGVDVIFVTAAGDWEHIDHALKLGVVDYLIKPVDFERMQMTLNEYRNRQALVQPKAQMTQKELDAILNRREGVQTNALQKGVHKRTLEYVRDFLNRFEGEVITANDMAAKLGISKVTARRYLEYLESIGELELCIEYGTVGRPTYNYRRSVRKSGDIS